MIHDEAWKCGVLIFRLKGVIAVEDYSILEVLLYIVLKCVATVEGFKIRDFIEMYLYKLSYAKALP